MFKNDLEWVAHFLSKGYLLHGSPRRLEYLMPHQAHDTERLSGCHKGIYATRHQLVAIVSSLLARGPRCYTMWDGSGSDLRVVGYNARWGEKGYVYLLHPASFKQLREDDGSLSSDYIAREIVHPQGAAIFTPEILPQLPITFQFYPLENT